MKRRPSPILEGGIQTGKRHDLAVMPPGILYIVIKIRDDFDNEGLYGRSDVRVDQEIAAVGSRR